MFFVYLLIGLNVKLSHVLQFQVLCETIGKKLGKLALVSYNFIFPFVVPIETGIEFMNLKLAE